MTAMAVAAEMSQIEARRLRNAFGAFATGVVIVTAWDEAMGPLGMTMNSFSSVSLRPPLIMFSIERRAASLPGWLRAGGYAVHVLAHSQESLSKRFARALSDKWAGLRFQRGLHGAPLLSDAAARFECSARQRLDGGDHIVFLARIERYEDTGGNDPLLFYRGRYAGITCSADDEAPGPAVWPLSIHY